MTTKNEYIEKLETMIGETRARLAQEATTGQDRIDALQVEIEALEAGLVGLPGQAKAMRNAGRITEARAVLDNVESLNIQIARLQVKKAQLEADRKAEVSRKFSAIIPEVSKISMEGMIAAEQALKQAREDYQTIQTYAQGINSHAWAFYGQPAEEAHERLQEAQRRLDMAVSTDYKLPAAS